MKRILLVAFSIYLPCIALSAIASDDLGFDLSLKPTKIVHATCRIHLCPYSDTFYRSIAMELELKGYISVCGQERIEGDLIIEAGKGYYKKAPLGFLKRKSTFIIARQAKKDEVPSASAIFVAEGESEWSGDKETIDLQTANEIRFQIPYCTSLNSKR